MLKMSLASIKSAFKREFVNIPGWRTRRHLIIFESDDWGSVRMPSTDAYNSLVSRGFDLSADDGASFNKYDSLATSEDLAKLFEVLCSYRDFSGSAAVFTPVSVVANPDFKMIKESGYKEYIFEPFTETLKRYPGCVNAFDLWKEGIEKGIFMPQFHGREHLNVNVWMKALKEGNVRVHTAFENEMWGITTAEDNEILIELQAAFDFIDPKDLIDHEKIILSGLDLFEKLFGYRATCFVPPNGPFSSRLEASCFSSGIKMIMVPRFRKEPVGYGKRLMRIHWLGQNSKTGLRYYTRNCLFEPARPGFDWVKGCLNQISVALRWHKPAIISSHRMNYIGSLYPENRQNGLNQLAALLENILCIWPDVEFVSSGDLVKIMSDE